MLVIMSCTPKKPKDGFLLQATVDNFNGYLFYPKDYNIKTREQDSVLVKNGKFILTGKVEDFASIYICTKDQQGISFCIENSDMQLNWSSIAPKEQKQEFTLSGCNAYDADTQYSNSIKHSTEKYKGANKASAQQYLLHQAYYVFEKYKDHPISLRNLLKIVNYNFRSGQGGTLEMQKILDILRPAFGKEKSFQKCEELCNAQKRREIGQTIFEYKGIKPDSTSTNIHNYLGESYVLIDLWASWCGGCRKDIPNVKKAYNKYKNKGFKVIAISFDSDLKKWNKAINEDLSFNFIHMSQLKGWQDEIGINYGINGIPDNILIDKNGIIIRNGIKGVALHETLEMLYQNI